MSIRRRSGDASRGTRRRPLHLAYIHDAEDWAIHNVGKLWLGDPPPNIRVSMLHEPPAEELRHFDMVWFGYYSLWKRRYRRHYPTTRSIISVHDPSELPVVKLRRSWGAVIVTASLEMKDSLARRGVDATVVPTAPALQLRRLDCVGREPPRLVAISSKYPRKNTEGVERLFDRCRDELGLVCTGKFGHTVLGIEQYQSLLDRHNVFVCMSRQEGGPLPAMEAMARGCVVLSTRVGQMPELLDGRNGFVLDEEDFFEKVVWMCGNPDWLAAGRKRAIDTMRNERSPSLIRARVRALLDAVVARSRLSRAIRGR